MIRGKAFSQAVAYPWIDVHDLGWLRSALLLWERISTIVPAGLSDPYTSRDAKELAALGLLAPIEVDPDDPAVQEASYMLDNLVPLWGETLVTAPPVASNDLFTREWKLQEYTTIHERKLYTKYHIEVLDPETHRRRREGGYSYLYRETGAPAEPGSKTPWLRVRTPIAVLYLTALASRVAERRGLGLVTVDEGLVPWLEAVVGGYKPAEEIVAAGVKLIGPYPEEELYAHDAEASVALVKAAFSLVSVHADTPIKNLVAFRERHQTEFDRFRSAIQGMGAALSGDYPTIEAFQQAIENQFEMKIRPAVMDLERARMSANIRVAPDLLQATSFSFSPALAALAAGRPAVSALAGVAGLGTSVALAVRKLTAEREAALIGQPFSFVVSARREFGSA
jgi:hypothetical protein